MTVKITRSNYREKTFLVTPSLLNSWGYIWECVNNVREFESDEVCLEDKIKDAQEKAYNEFLKVLRREPTETNEYMLRGIEFEDECYKGNTCVSPIIEGGAYQIVGKKVKNIDGLNFLLYGRLDVLKGGTIYDIKRVSNYKVQKYIHSYQHPFYLELFQRAGKFTYLAYDGKNLHQETYYRDECLDICVVIKNFIGWLKAHGLFGIYASKWCAR